jgi:hypothetical protein
MAGRDKTLSNEMAGQRRVSTASFSSLYDENSPLILASENSLPKYGINESALEDAENDSENETDLVSTGNHNQRGSTSPRTVILVFVVGMDPMRPFPVTKTQFKAKTFMKGFFLHSLIQASLWLRMVL